eukprot:3662619-Amphidinium_carterae.1
MIPPKKTCFLEAANGSSWEPGCDFGRKTRATGNAISLRGLCARRNWFVSPRPQCRMENKIPEKALTLQSCYFPNSLFFTDCVMVLNLSEEIRAPTG